MLKPLRLLFLGLTVAAASFAGAMAQSVDQTKGSYIDRFRQLDEVLPTPNVYRTASGAPGADYWQQRADYNIRVRLDDEGKRLTGNQTVTYTNQSPDTLVYLWFQLEQNRFDAKSHSRLSETDADDGSLSYDRLDEILTTERGDFGIEVTNLRDDEDRALATTVVDTMMRVDLAEPLAPGDTIELTMDFAFNVIPGKAVSNRNGYEILDDGSSNYFLSLFYPRLAAYTDFDGWITKAFLYVEYALEFGDFRMEITVPDTFTVAATGQLTNADAVLSLAQRQRLEQARTAERPIYIITKEEAEAQADLKPATEKTWIFEARNVRDVAFAASPRFVWDAMAVRQQGGRDVLAMSAYPPEGMPLWNKYSTHAIAHTIEYMARNVLPYPYPVAWSINAPIRSGMEFPMMAANAPRPEPDDDGTYSRRTKYGLIGVVIHEVMHNWFPMIINTSERHYIWMDEGMTSYWTGRVENAWERNYPGLDTLMDRAASYMTSSDHQPIMTQGDNLIQRGANAYRKVDAALNVLREVVIGRELFDEAFREYARRWAFKRPMPADFFRTMEDASGKDLDWFWRSWFYTTEHVDVSVDGVTIARIDTKDPDVERPRDRQEDANAGKGLLALRNQPLEKRVDRFPGLLDFYDENDEFTVTQKERKAYQAMLAGLDEDEKAMLQSSPVQFIHFTNHGGVPSPLPLVLTFDDGSTEELLIPAEIWRQGQKSVSKALLRDRTITAVAIDPDRAIADAQPENNVWPREMQTRRLELIKRSPARNMMKEVRDGQNAKQDN